jgi:hypothetical protein
MKFEEA